MGNPVRDLIKAHIRREHDQESGTNPNLFGIFSNPGNLLGTVLGNLLGKRLWEPCLGTLLGSRENPTEDPKLPAVGEKQAPFPTTAFEYKSMN